MGREPRASGYTSIAGAAPATAGTSRLGSGQEEEENWAEASPDLALPSSASSSSSSRRWRAATCTWAGGLLCAVLGVTWLAQRGPQVRSHISLGLQSKVLERAEGEGKEEDGGGAGQAEGQPTRLIAPCGLVEQDTDYGWDASELSLDHIPSIAMCCAMCQGIPECKSWVWRDGGLSGDPHQCWVKRREPLEKRFVPGVVSGLPPPRPKLPEICSAAPSTQQQPAVVVEMTEQQQVGKDKAGGGPYSQEAADPAQVAVAREPFEMAASVPSVPLAAAGRRLADLGSTVELEEQPSSRRQLLEERGGSDVGENCWLTRACKDPSMHCYMKNPAWAGCRQSCRQGLDPEDPLDARTPWACVDVTMTGRSGLPAALPVALPTEAMEAVGGDEGGGGARLELASSSGGGSSTREGLVLKSREPSCLGLSERSGEGDEEEEERQGQTHSLWCFSVVQPKGYELSLVQAQHALGLSIFACDAWALYSNASVEAVPGYRTSILLESKLSGAGKDGGGGPLNLSCEFHEIAWNTGIFISVWRKVLADGFYQAFDWTVKVDADTVFFPSRLRPILAEHRAAGYLNNCKYGLHGPIEVLSTRAMTVLAQDYAASDGGEVPARCMARFPEATSGPAQWGEDMFLDRCLSEVLGLNSVQVDRLICEDHCDCPDWFWCSNGTERVAYHPFKREDLYRQCVANAIAPSRVAEVATATA